MKRFLLIPLVSVACIGLAQASPCTTALLPVYQNSGSLFSCSESSELTIVFNNTLLPNYVGLNLFSSNNSAAAPSSITVTPGSASLTFSSSTFNESAAVASSQAELVHFTVLSAAGTSFGSTTFSLNNASVSTGGSGLGSGVAVGQELVCVGGSFTSLPLGLVTSVLSGVLSGPGNTYGCNGVTLVGTASVSSSPVNALTGLLGLPSLTGLTDTAAIQLGAYNTTQIDVIKILALTATLGGSASVSSFGDGFVQNAVASPEPGPAALLLGGVAFMFASFRRRKTAK